MILYQGIEGSFSHLTAKRVFGENALLKGVHSFEEAFQEGEKTGALFLPIENTLVGTIYETLDGLQKTSLFVTGVAVTPISHSLLGCFGSEVHTLTHVLSHPKALGQCAQFLKKHNLIPIPYYDTAGAALEVAKRGDLHVGAIAHAQNGNLYGLSVLQQEIQDNSANFTRFFLLEKEKKAGKKQAVLFTLAHEVGALAKVLSSLAEEGVNVTYIVSRPLLGKPFEYLFYLEIDAQKPFTWEKIQRQTLFFKHLGSYDNLE